MFKSYRNRVQVDGQTNQEALKATSKRQMVNFILDSPSLSHVYVNMNETLSIPTISTDIRTFHERKFLFLPDLNVNVGDYVTHGEFTYLSVDKIVNDMYPQLTGMLCNIEFPIHTEERKIKVGIDSLGRPIYKTELITINKPCVMTDKIYSQANNSPIPLPDGAMLITLPYSEEDNHTPKVNSIISIHNDQYQVTYISYEKVINNIGVIEVQLQRMPNT
ncbi:hypothetical protein ACIQ1D_19415 [Lysinibacillus xylanilyticus]|uniref:hypothetical protein n=1 Tax=Lysinibacillus xylanilyticus TaxID=582475 RepID=UPI00382B4936